MFALHDKPSFWNRDNICSCFGYIFRALHGMREKYKVKVKILAELLQISNNELQRTKSKWHPFNLRVNMNWQGYLSNGCC